MQEPLDEQVPAEEPANLRFLRRLVTVLTATMILGVGLIAVLLVARLSQTPELTLPDTITLPGGARPIAITAAPNWYAVVTSNDEILIFDRDTGNLHQSVTILPQQ